MGVKPTFEYRARLIRVIDGDTIFVEIDLGFRTYRQDALRLLGINTPELVGANKAAGIAARDHLINLLPTYFLIRTFKNPTDKYGRWLAEIYTDDYFINGKMVADGHAVANEMR